MKPYIIEYTVTAVVMAEDDNDAWHVAREVKRDAILDGDPDMYVGREVESEADLQGTGWDLQCIPYGGDGNTRLSDLIDLAKSARVQ